MTDVSGLAARISKLAARKNPYFPKDLAKAARADKFIGRGSARSSTNAYRIAAGDLANPGAYCRTDRVFVSAEGYRTGRIGPDWTELTKAVAAGATMITDIAADRERPYNIGEREIAEWLSKIGYCETAPGTWAPRDTGSV